MSDELDLFDERPVREAPTGAARRARKRRTRLIVFGLVVALLIAGGVWYGWRQLSGIGGFDDFAGAGESDVVVEVKGGDTTGTIASTLVSQGVVASARAFLTAAENEPKVRSIQPGFYVMRTKMAGKEAVGRMVDPKVKVGQLQIKPGTQLDDIAKGDGSTVPGIVSLLAQASCAELNGKSTCVPVEELRRVSETADLAALGVPDWALADAARAPEPKRRLEGLIAPSVYDVKPGSTAEELWKKVVTDSSALLQSYGMPRLGETSGFTPYQILVMGSLVQREAVSGDFGKVARVTYNRLAEGMKLEYDSTVNYVLDRPEITTTAADRARQGPYNTYATPGLPPTPIAATSKDALAAAAKPEEGTWLFFVVCQKNGTSCFANTFPEHQANIRLARDNGAY